MLSIALTLVVLGAAPATSPAAAATPAASPAASPATTAATTGGTRTTHVAHGKLTVTSSDLKNGGTVGDKFVFNGMGCTGENVSPEIGWSGAPADTKSFVVTAYDPDAPTGSGWWHWVVYDIPADAKELPQGAGSGKAELPTGAVQGKTDFGQPGWGGPCPPAGDRPHHYVFTVTALKVDKLDVPEGASAAYVGFMTHMNSLGSAKLTATYGRKK